MRCQSIGVVGMSVLLLLASVSRGEIQVVAQCNRDGDATPEFRFGNVVSPSSNDAATQATLVLLDGRRDSNSGEIQTLCDGVVPDGDDEPSENYFFAAGTDGGRLLLDLGSTIDIKQVNTFSWHRSARGPQVYRLYASAGIADGFQARPTKDVDLATSGWTHLASVDTRPPSGSFGGQYGVSVSGSDDSIGQYRYLLFDFARTETSDSFGNTFFSEIDVIDRNAAVQAATPVVRPGRRTFEAGNGKYHILVDTSETPDLTPWVENELMPVIVQWYPKIVQLLPSEGYEAPGKISIMFSQDMQGVAATAGTRVQCAASWFRKNLQGEAKGAVVHELVHVVQQYGRARRGNRQAERTPDWLVEGIADYVRWFLYEPESHGADITRRNLARARYDASYRVSANFLNWATASCDSQLVPKLNAAAREGRYSDSLWQELTGRSVRELGDEWKASLEKQLAGAIENDR